jgi:hypothetical protein
MSLAELKDEAAHLSAQEQRELIAFLVALETQADQAFREQLAAKIDDRDPAHWIELERLREKFVE